jgi:hypothetical protein
MSLLTIAKAFFTGVAWTAVGVFVGRFLSALFFRRK